MDRWRAAGALLALAACIASSAAAPTASNQTALDLYEGSAEGCYYNFQHYGEGDRIMTNEPCLNCTCHDRMLMCYLRVCPFTKAIGQDCTVEKRADQCCPIVTCPDVPVDLLTSTSTTSPAEYGATGLGKLDKYGCSINGKYFPEGSKVPPTPNKPCEHCYCIRNMTTCVMQECTLHVDGCTPIYHKDVCCPVRYSCDHPEDEVPLLDDMSTTVRPTPGFLLTTTTVAPVTQMTQDCVHDDQVFADGALIKTEKACEHCYCMKGDIVCVVQECGAPMENEGKNCTSLPPREGQCCPDTYICEGDELNSEISPESTTESIEIITTLSPPRRAGVEGSGYRNEPDEVPNIESEVEGSGEDQEISKPLDDRDEMIPDSEDGEQYMYVSTKSPTSDEYERTSTENIKDIVTDIEEKTDKPEQYTPTPTVPPKDLSEKYTTSGIPEEEILQVHEHIPTTNAPEIYERTTMEVGESFNTVPDIIPEEELIKPHEFTPSTTSSSVKKEGGIPINEITISAHSETSMPEYSTLSSISENEIEKDIFTSDEILNVTPEVITKKDHPKDDNDITSSTAATIIEESENPALQESEEEKESSKPEQFTLGTTSYPLEESDKLTTEPDHAQNTVAVAEEETVHPHIRIPMTTTALPSVEEKTTTISSVQDNITTEKDIKEDVLEPHEHVTTGAPTLEETELTTAKPDKEVNTIPSESDEKTSLEPDIPEKTTPFEETKTTESSDITEDVETHYVDTKQTTVAETATRTPDSIVTKVDQYTITTEPSFRKEDESSVSTQKPKDFESNTDRSEFVDEGLIPTSDQHDKASPDVPSTEEEFTTLVPEYITTPSILEASIVAENLPGESTEKTPDFTTSIGESVDTHEEPSRIPGEGDCLVNGITYRNNSVVPSSNNCHSGCRCASSIIKCDPIICSPPPDYMDNCQSIYDTPDSCCPTYVCDHSRETVPPQSDNQMSGTESPLPTPTIECRGDQCEISEPAKPSTGPSELCLSGSCLSETDHKSDTECGPEGCSNLAQKPEVAVEKTEKCSDGKCKPETSTQVQVSPIKPCEGEYCETVDELIHPTSPQLCNNEEDCKSLEIPLVQAKPCEGESCKNINCGDGSCVPDVLPNENESVPCSDENGCKSQNIPIQDCTGDEPCKKKEIIANEEKLPTECEGSNCKQESGITDTLNVDTLSTKLPAPFEEITEKGVTAEEEKATELPGKITPKDTTETETYSTENQLNAVTTDIDIVKPSVLEESPIKKPTKSEEENTEAPTADKGDEKTPVDSEITEKPELIETEVAETSGVVEQGTNKPAILGEEVTEKPVKVEDKTTELPAVFDMGTEELEKPADIEREGTELPTFIEEEGTQKPTIIDEEVEENPITVNEHDVKKPDEEAEVKPVLVDEKVVNEPIEVGTKTPVIIEEEGSTKPSVYEGESTYKPNIYEKEGTEIPVVTEEKDQDKPILVPEDIEKQEIEKPDVVKESTDITPVHSDSESKDKPNIIDDTSKLSTTEGLTEDSFREVTTEKLIEGEGTEKPAIISEDGGEKPVIIYEETTKKPDISAEEETTKPIETEEKPDSEAPIVIEEKSTEKTLTDKESEEEPTVIRENDIEKPTDNEAEKEKPAVDNEATEKPITEEDTKQTPASDHRDSTEQPALIIDKESPETPSVSTEESSVIPVDGEKSSESPSMFTEEGTEEPTMVEGEIEDSKNPVFVGEENTEKPIIIDEEFKEKPPAFNNENNIIEDESTKTPLVTEEENKIKPSTSEEENTDKPAPTKEEDTEKPAHDKNKDTMKPVYIEREGTELPVIIGEENTEKPSLIDEITKDQPTVVDEEGTKKPDVIEEEGTKKPAFEAESTSQSAIIDEKEYITEPDFVEKEVTNMPTYTEEAGPEKPLIIEGDKMKPTIEEENVDKPVSTLEASTDKPIVVEEEGKDKPPIIDDELKQKPAVIEEQSTEKSEEDGADTLKPETYPAEPEKEVKEPEIIVPTTKTTSDFEEITTTQVYDSQTSSPIVNEYSTEFITARPIEISTFPQEISPSETPVIKVTKSDDSDSKVPVILDHSNTPELVTDHSMEPEITTKIASVATVSEEAVTSILEKEKEPVTVSSISDLDVLTTNSYVDKTDTEEVVGTMGPDSTIDKEMLTTQSPDVYEVTEAKDKTTETEPVSEHEEGLTVTSEPKLPTTKAPGVDADLIEPQEETKPEKSDIPVTSETEEESTTKYYQEEKYKPVPESHVVEDTSPTPEQSDISGTAVPENKDKDKLETESLGQYTPEPEKVVTQLSEEDNLRTDHPEIYNLNKDTITTETYANTVTETVSKFTEIEDTSLTGLEDIATGYPEKSTEYHVPSATEKTDQHLDMTTTGSEQSPKLPENTIEFDKPSIEKEKPAIIEKATTEIPISVVTETQDISHASEKDVTSFEETTTGISNTSEHKFTTPMEEYTEKQDASTKIPPYSVNVPQEHSEATELYVTEHYTTESHQEISTKSEEQEATQVLTTDTRRTTVQEEESVTKTPETIHTKPHSEDQNKPSIEETQTQSAELPLENAQTETPGVEVTSEIPQSHVTEYQEEVTVAKEELTIKPDLLTPQHEEVTKATESHITEEEEIQTDAPIHVSEPVELSTKSTELHATEQEIKITEAPEDAVTEKLDTATTLRETPEVSHEIPTEKTDSETKLADVTTVKPIDEGMKSTEYTSSQSEFSETTPYLIELEEHPHNIGEDYSTTTPSEEEHTYKPIKDISTSSPSAEEHTYKNEEHSSTIPSIEEKQATTLHPEAVQEPQISELTTKTADEEIEMTTKEAEGTSKPSQESLPEQVTEKISESLPVEGTTETNVQNLDSKYTVDHKEYTTSAPTQFNKESTPALDTDSEKLPISESNDIVPTEKETSSSETPSHLITSQETTIPEEEFIFATTKATTLKQDEEILKPVSEDKFAKPEQPTKTSEIPTSSTTTEASKPSVADIQPTDEIPAPEEEGHFPPSGTSGYGEPEPDYVEEDQAFGPGTCRYGGKVYVSAQQIPRDDPCDFCFCFRSDIICLQQSCPPPIHGCHEEPIQGFCCPRYECPVSMATTVNVTTTTTTTTTTLPPHFPTHSYKGAAQRRGCQIKGHTYKVGEVVRSSSGPCLHCTCGGDGQMKCDPKACTPEPMLRQMIAAAVSAKRRR